MSIKHESRIEVACDLNKEDIQRNCDALSAHGVAGDKAIKVLRDIGKVIQMLDEAAGTFRLIIAVKSDGKTETSLKLDGISSDFKSKSRSDQVWSIELKSIPGLSTRARTILEMQRLSTMGDLAQKTEHEVLRSFRGCGRVTMLEFKKVLAAHGLSFGMQTPPA